MAGVAVARRQWREALKLAAIQYNIVSKKRRGRNCHVSGIMYQHNIICNIIISSQYSSICIFNKRPKGSEATEISDLMAILMGRKQAGGGEMANVWRVRQGE